MEGTATQRHTRKVHDIWALVAFAVYSATTNCLMIMHDRTKQHQVDLGLVYRISRDAGAFMVVFVLVTLLAFRFVPKPTLHASFVASIAFFLVLAAASSSALGILLFFLGAGMSLYVYIYWGMKFIPFTSEVLKGATTMILEHGLSIFLVHILVTAVFAAQAVLSFLTLFSTDVREEYYLHIMFFLQMTWSAANAMYFFTVFVSSIISIHLFNAGRPVRTLIEPLANTLYAAGSICLGGLLLAVVYVMRYMLRQSVSEDRRRRGEQSVLERIFVVILEILLVFLEEIIQLANDWVFVYIAVYGKSYKKALRGSFEKASEPGNNVMISSLIVGKALWFFGLVGMVSYMAMIYMAIGFDVIIQTWSSREFHLPTLVVTFFLITFLSMFSAGTKCILFVYSERADCVEKVLPVVHAAAKRHLPDFIKEDGVVSLKRQDNALSNNVFIVETPGKKLVVKEYKSEVEIQMLELMGLPKIVHRSESVLVEEYIEHRKADFSRDWQEIAHFLGRFHRTHVPFELRTHEELVGSIVEGDLAGLDGRVLGVLRKTKAAMDGLLRGASAEAPTYSGLCHNDLQLGNILVTDGGIVFIDFEYSCVGDQLVDIANVFCEVMCDYSCSAFDVSRRWSPVQRHAFLCEYLGGRDADHQKLLDRIARLEHFSHFLWYLWGRRSLLQRKSAVGFSYLRYTQSRLAFLRDIMEEDDFRILDDDLKNLAEEQ
ncbi:UNVERIFIED_CONTAM: hypothetical protein PYX00_011509 [Menopon gallinae]|uniref:Choline transporter-like protein n=1 Tax=Menopon gallinae TaxID=328185 RepID=A0AAW2H7M8_9NEOP